MHDSWITRFLVFIVCCSIPFLGGNHLPLFYVTIDKFWIENIFLLCLIISLMFLFLNRKHVAAFTGGRFYLFFAPYLLITIISLFFTWNALSTLKEINALIWVAGVVFLAGSLADKDSVLKALVAGAFLSSLCSILQFTVLYPKLMDVLQQSKYALLVETQAIPFSSFLYHNIFGGYLSSIVPISLYFAVYKKRVFYSITTIIILTALVLTTTRIGIALAVLSVLVLLLLSVRDRNVKGFFHITALACVGLLAAVLLMNIHIKDTPKGVQREIAKKITSIPAQIKTLNTRTEIWKGGIRAFVHKPILGYGAGTFEYPYKKYYDGGFGTKYAHSTLIKIGVELGGVGILCWLFYFAGCFVWIRNIIWDRRIIHVFLAASSFFFFGLFDFSFDTPAHMITFFLLTSLLIRSDSEKDILPRVSVKIREKNVAVYCITMLLIIFCVFSFYFTTRVNLANKAIENGTSMEEIGFPPIEAYRNYEDAIEKMPLNNEGYIKAIEALMGFLNNDKDVVRKEETKRILLNHLQKMEKSKDNNSELFYIIGIGYATLGNKEKADYYVTKALFYLPSSAYYALRSAEYYFYSGDTNKAVKTVKSFTSYLDNYENTRNPNGYYVYKMRDLEVEILLREGNAQDALSLARENLRDAERERFVITSVRARELVKKEAVVGHLRRRVDYVKSQIEMK